MSENTVSAQERIEALTLEIQAKRNELNELRHSLPQEEVGEYTFAGIDGKEYQLTDLFGNKNDLIVIHNMGKSCPYCTLWADGFEGMREHLENRAALALVSPNSPEEVREFAGGRGWKFRAVSSAGNSFSSDMGYESEKGGQMPGISTFVRSEDGRIRRVATAPFGPGDDFCSAWHMFDLLAGGQDNWAPQFSYK